SPVAPVQPCRFGWLVVHLGAYDRRMCRPCRGDRSIRRAGLTAMPPDPRLEVEDMETQRAKSGSAIEPSAAAPATGGAAGLPVLSVRLLGDLDLRLGDSPLPPLESARAESLLAFLLLHRNAAQP